MNERTQSRAEATWHDGERTLQTTVGMRERMEDRGRIVLRDHMPDQHRQFFAERNQLFLALLDEAGWPWPTLVEGDVGFIHSPHPRQLVVSAELPPLDPASSGMREGAPVGTLGIEFESRRRNRLNGTIGLLPGGAGFSIQVTQSFGNCPKYIQARNIAQIIDRNETATNPRPDYATSLSAGDVKMIEASDTFFISSRSRSPGASREQGLDISHRGGRRGFVVVESPTRLMFPDYQGNFFFNTLGNLQVDARCGLLFLDFDGGATLQLVGRGTMLVDAAVYAHWPGALRAVSLEIHRVVRTSSRSRYTWSFGGFAPQFT